MRRTDTFLRRPRVEQVEVMDEEEEEEDQEFEGTMQIDGGEDSSSQAEEVPDVRIIPAEGESDPTANISLDSGCSCKVIDGMKWKFHEDDPIEGIEDWEGFADPDHNYCYLCATPDDASNRSRQYIMELTKMVDKWDDFALCTSIYLYYRAYIFPDTQKDWGMKVIAAHIKRHTINAKALITEEVRIINSLIDHAAQTTCMEDEEGQLRPLSKAQTSIMLNLMKQRRQALGQLSKLKDT